MAQATGRIRRRRWTDDERSTVARLFETTPCSHIGSLISRSERAVAHEASRLGLARTPEQQQLIDDAARAASGLAKKGKPRKHGLCCAGEKHELYSVWVSMKTRCLNPRARSFKNYGARGIKVCDRWMNSFEAFQNDMGARPAGMTLERVDVNRGYEPGNCVWATRSRQARNKRRTPLLEAFGRRQCLADWADEFGVPHRLVDNRVRRLGWSLEDALLRVAESRPKQGRNLGELRKVRK